MPEEIKPEVVQKTQKYLGKYVKKPQLTDKLLKKPPFRFLHDIVNAVIKETGFLKGLFTEDELNSDNVKDRDAKVAFLTKLIDAVKSVSGTELAARPSKIVAGLEPTDTNILLQTIAKAIDKKTDSSNYVNGLHSVQTDGDKKQKVKSKSNDKIKKTTKPTHDTKIQESPKPKTETPKSTDREKTRKTTKVTEDSKNKSRDKEKARKLKDKQPSQERVLKKTSPRESTKQVEDEIINPTTLPTKTDPNPEETVQQPEEQPREPSPIINENETIKKRMTSAARPKSARPRSGEIREKPPEDPVQRPPTSLRPPSVRPSSARPGAPRLRPESAIPMQEVVPMGKINVIVENVDTALDEEETVVIQSGSEEVHDENVTRGTLIPEDNKGHLVEQILEQINEGQGDGAKIGKTEIDWQLEGSYSKEASKEITNLCSMIQSMTKSANPLGKLLNYLHEDIDAMHVELQMWSNMKRQLHADITKQKKAGLEMNKPLINQLENINQEIKKMEEEISHSRSNILRNEARIEELLTKK